MIPGAPAARPTLVVVPVQYSPDGHYYWDGRRWIPVRAQPANPRGSGAVRGFAFSFTVGAVERHTVHFFYDQFWGRLRISVDGRVVMRKLHLFSFRTTRRYRFTVGERERHEVLIEKKRKVLYAGFRAQTCTVFIDGEPAGEYKS